MISPSFFRLETKSGGYIELTLQDEGCEIEVWDSIESAREVLSVDEMDLLIAQLQALRRQFL